MNPIENIWSVLKMKVGKMRPSTKEQLISYTLETQNSDDTIKAMCKTLVEGMGKRVAQLKKNAGKHTSY